MIYQYNCSNGHTLEVVQSIHDEALTKCDCGGELERIITGGLGTIFETKTLGSLVEQNRRKMGHYEKENVDRPAREREQAKKDAAPWWRPNTTEPNRKLATMTPEQQQRFIEGG